MWSLGFSHSEESGLFPWCAGDTSHRRCPNPSPTRAPVRALAPAIPIPRTDPGSRFFRQPQTTSDHLRLLPWSLFLCFFLGTYHYLKLSWCLLVYLFGVCLILQVHELCESRNLVFICALMYARWLEKCLRYSRKPVNACGRTEGLSSTKKPWQLLDYEMTWWNCSGKTILAVGLGWVVWDTYLGQEQWEDSRSRLDVSATGQDRSCGKRCGRARWI